MGDPQGACRRRAPSCFGPGPSPRQDSAGKPWGDPMARITALSASFLTDAKALESLLPVGAQLAGEPVVTVEFMTIRELQWLAGRGYSTLGVHFPIIAEAGSEIARGPFLTVLWENLADPILTGREELGFAKLFCDLPAPTQLAGVTSCRASWDGHEFCSLEIADAQDTPLEPAASDGMLHHFSVPKIGSAGETLAQGWAITPPSLKTEVLSHRRGHGNVSFVRSTWQQLPTLAHIVNRLADLPMLDARGGSIKELCSDTSLHNHRLLGGV
jgi:hypothetical protein